MTEKPSRLQGTDGIRGRIAKDQALGDNNPVDFFLNTKRLTPAFFERYTFAFGTLLIDSGLAKKNDSLVIGWDPRDQEGQFNQAAIRGIRKSGLKAVTLGSLPTPAMPLFMQSVKAAGSIVLTASHNPADQNGIKLFCGVTALKLLPPDDSLLTNLLYKQLSINLEDLEMTGGIEQRAAEAKEYFVNYCLNPHNSWINGEDFQNTIVLIDASNGAAAEVVEDVFSRLPFREVIFTNMSGSINQNSGVADIEGLKTIPRESVIGPDATFSSYRTLVALFEKASFWKESIANDMKLVAFVFDGDGDRCYRLDYIPEIDGIHVSSGDLLGIHQAKYIAKEKQNHNTLFINTVESDLNTAIMARELGFTPILTGVGDKWILTKAVIDLVLCSLPQDDTLKQQFAELIDKTEGMSALAISKFWINYSQDFLLPHASQTSFRIGIEESGHCITPGLAKADGATFTTFSGNGIKTALNSLLAISKTIPDRNWYRTIREPFPTGICRTFYTYYVDKDRLSHGNHFREQFQSAVQERFYKFFPSSFTLDIIEFSEEKEMLYCGILENEQQYGAIFCRNSGTEDKSALYLRGESRLAVPLEQLGQELHLIMLKGLKDLSSEFTQCEIELLRALQNGKGCESLNSDYPDLPVERILKEVEFKEGLIQTVQGQPILTKKGRQFVSVWA